MPFSTRRRVGYFYDADVGNFYYAQGHPMKPHRMRMTHNLLVAYNLFERMDILTSPRATEREMTRFHSDEYINFLKVVTPDNMTEQVTNLARFNILEDCPVFDGLWEYCQIAAGGSLAGAARLNSGESSTVINWAGGLHHAKRAEASGFCYINDCVLAILELLKLHARVLYVDIDIHHGDGVEEAFYTTDRVMTVSFHKFGDYFPGTGDVTDVGTGRGKNYSVNFPLKDGITDDSYREIFVPVMRKVMEMYQPGAVVLQCGADSLSGDRLGCFNLSLTGHSQCVDFFGEYDVPLLLVGGGGYTIRNVARCWAYETSRVLNADITDELPFNENYEFYGPEFRLHIATSNMEDHNTPAFLNKTKAKIFEQLRSLAHVPSAPFMDVPRTAPLGVHNRDYDSDNDDPDVRKKSTRAKHIVEYEGSDDEGDDDQFLSSLRVARKKVRKATFPRRSASKVQRTSTTLGPSSTASNRFGPADDTPHLPVISINGSHVPQFGTNHTSILVANRKSTTAATSDERVESRPSLFPLGSEALETNVDSSTGGKRMEHLNRKNLLPTSDAGRERMDSDGIRLDETTPPQDLSKEKGSNVDDSGTAEDKLSPSRDKGVDSPVPEKTDVAHEPKSSQRTDGRTTESSLRGASPSPENVMMDDEAPTIPPLASGKREEWNEVSKEAPSIGITEVAAPESKQSPNDTSEKADQSKPSEPALPADADFPQGSDKTTETRLEKDDSKPASDERQLASKPVTETTACHSAVDTIKPEHSSDERHKAADGAEKTKSRNEMPKDVEKDVRPRDVKSGDDVDLDQASSVPASVSDGEKSKLAEPEKAREGGNKDDHLAQISSDKAERSN